MLHPLVLRLSSVGVFWCFLQPWGAWTELNAQTLADPRLKVETFAAGMSRPVSFDFVDDNNLMVLQNLDGQVVVTDGVDFTTVLDLTVSFQGGLGLIFDPDFADNGFVYVFHADSTAGDGGSWAGNRLLRYRYDGQTLVEPFGPLFSCPLDPLQSNLDDHNGGTLRFGPDGFLYGQAGDKHRGDFLNPRIEQNTGAVDSALAGGIFRVATDGSIPADNPFADHPDPALHPWFVVGFRNSLGMDFDPLTGLLWFGDNGSTNYDEINRAASGMNGGWLKIMGPDARDATYDENAGVAFDEADLPALAGSFYRDPEFSFAAPIGIAGMAFLDSNRFPVDLRHNLIVGESNNGQLYRFELDPTRQHLVLPGGATDGVADSTQERDLFRFGTGFGVVTDIRIGPDGYLYLTDYFGGRIRRIRPCEDLYEPVSVHVVQGVVRRGDAGSLLLSDDDSLLLSGALAGNAPLPFGEQLSRLVLECSFQLNQTAPSRLDVVVEARVNLPQSSQVLELFDFSAGRFVMLDAGIVSDMDTVIRADDVANPSSYVDPVTREALLRVIYEASRAPELKSFIDELHLEVTWP